MAATFEAAKVAVREIVLELSESEEVVVEDTELLLSGLLDSMAVVQVVATMEQCLDQEVPPLDITIENFETLGAMFNYVAARLQAS